MRIAHTIPEKSDQIAWRKARGSAGGRPPAFDSDAYRQRNTIERSFNRLKQWRGIATRYDKYATTYLGGVLLASLIIYHHNHSPDTAWTPHREWSPTEGPPVSRPPSRHRCCRHSLDEPVQVRRLAMHAPGAWANPRCTSGGNH